MLKITLNEQPTALTLVFEGRLSEPCTSEAEQCWRDAITRAGNKEINLDLNGVSFVDVAGESLLGKILERGATVHADGVLMAHLVEELRHKQAIPETTDSRRTPRPHRSPGA